MRYFSTKFFPRMDIAVCYYGQLLCTSELQSIPQAHESDLAKNAPASLNDKQ